MPVRRISHSFFCVPSAIRKECEKITETAANRRSASKLLRLDIAGLVAAAPLAVDQAGDALAVQRRVTKRDLAGFGALEIELQIMLPGHADTAMQLDPVPATLRAMSEAAALAMDAASGASSIA